MNHEDSELPDPEELLHEVESMPRKVPLRDYDEVLSQMREKGYSYGEIAEWISQKLGAKVTRSQVFYLLNAPQEVQEADALAESMEEEKDESEEEQGR